MIFIVIFNVIIFTILAIIRNDEAQCDKKLAINDQEAALLNSSHYSHEQFVKLQAEEAAMPGCGGK